MFEVPALHFQIYLYKDLIKILEVNSKGGASYVSVRSGIRYCSTEEFKKLYYRKNGSKPIKEGVMRTVHIIRNNKCLEFRAALQLDPLEV
jgi:hypothetical protein